MSQDTLAPESFAPPGLVDSYQPLPGSYDELRGNDGQIRPHWEHFLDAADRREHVVHGNVECGQFPAELGVIFGRQTVALGDFHVFESVFDVINLLIEDAPDRFGCAAGVDSVLQRVEDVLCDVIVGHGLFRGLGSDGFRRAACLRESR